MAFFSNWFCSRNKETIRIPMGMIGVDLEGGSYTEAPLDKTKKGDYFAKTIIRPLLEFYPKIKIELDYDYFRYISDAYVNHLLDTLSTDELNRISFVGKNNYRKYWYAQKLKLWQRTAK